MAMFSYKGRDQSGNLSTGEVEAPDQFAAAELLVRRNLIPVSIEAKTSVSTGNGVIQWQLFQSRVGLEELAIFSRQMYSLTKSGIPILRAIGGLADSTSSKTFALALRGIVEQLERGRTLSSAMNLYPKIFNQLFVSVVHVGENTGKLDEVFLQLSRYIESELETRKQIKAATRYPTFVVIALIVAIVVLNIWVIPIFAQMFKKLGADLPPMTQVLIATSEFFVSYWPLLLVVTITAIAGLRHYVQTERGRYQWDRFSLRMPIIGNILERSLLSRFSRSFAMMLRSGVPLTTALNLVSDAVDNKYMGGKIIGIRRNIEKGDSLLRASVASGMFTPLVLQMFSVGEETGNVDDMLDDVAEYYEREVDYDIKNLTAKIEPVLIVIVAIMVLILALGIFTPMWDMANAYKGK
ncbi:type II secretion system F family protein [Neptunicella marina]|uniref:Type II secretion system F family protein n=1 Tax=Neptunicella marina TaxID=2125989 RepID=A0A8J6IV82_9ALTE|nr:type II secretion system F family protein [Neptunicella marina]MBC3766108.1 type II secretion system F family protein [Neptunicella marina]